MKRIYTLFVLVALICGMAVAQEADIRKAAGKYKNVKTLTAGVTMTRHNAALSDDVVSEGTLYFKKPCHLCMTFDSAAETLLTDGTTFTMIRNGKKRVAKSSGKGGNPFENVLCVFREMLAGDSKDADLSKLVRVKTTKQGGSCTVTITPVAAAGKSRRKAAFSSCVAEIDLNAGEMRTLRINERGENYTRYDFSHYELNARVPDEVFNK